MTTDSKFFTRVNVRQQQDCTVVLCVPVGTGAACTVSEGCHRCCSHSNSHHQVRGHRTESSYLSENKANQKWYTYISSLVQFIHSPKIYIIVRAGEHAKKRKRGQTPRRSKRKKKKRSIVISARIEKTAFFSQLFSTLF